MIENWKIKATSIVEAMVVMMIVVSWVVWMYTLLNKSTDLTISVKNKIQAIQIARQWIEGFTNIRDTNWILFSSDYINCWNVLKYNSLCIWDNTNTSDIKQSDNFKIYLDDDKRWTLTETGWFTPNDYTNIAYRNFYKVWLNNWIYTQSWITEDITPFYTREIDINYLKIDWTPWTEVDPKIKISSIVSWTDNTSSQPHKIVINQILSNWKSQK
jgi:hypothetical protein